MKKMSNDLERKWSNFLTSLENNHCEEKNYFEAIKYVSDIDSKTIDDEEIREKINGYIETIVQFIGKHKNYYELSNVKGFKKNDGSIRGRDYYYYIADQQIKATVYYARYLNFIEGCEITAERDLDVRVRLQNMADYYELLENSESTRKSRPSIENLFNDILYARENKKDEYTIGMITLYEENSEKKDSNGSKRTCRNSKVLIYK